MKKVIALVAAAAFVLSMATMASAAHEGRANLQTSGYLQTAVGFVDSSNFEKDGGDDFVAKQRLRQFFDYVASENLKATVGYEIDAEWGSEQAPVGADAGNTNPTDTANGADTDDILELKRANVEFTWPGTEMTIKSGLQSMSLPGVAMGYNPVLAGDMAGVTATAPLGMADLTVGWSRGYNQSTSDAAPGLDTFFATMPVEQDGMSFAPFAAYAAIGNQANLPSGNTGYRSGFNTPNGALGGGATGATASLEDSSAYWVGTNFELTQMDPIGVKASFIYGSLQADQDVNERSGWYADASVDYEMANMTPEVFVMYSSGEDDDATDGSETMPFVYNDGLTSKGPSMMIGDMTSLGINTPGVTLLQASPLGLMSAGATLKHIQLMDRLTGTVTAAYYQGTNDSDLATGLGQMDNALTDEDSAFDITASSTYELYENLSAICEVGYAKKDMDDGSDDEPAYRLATGLHYNF